MRVRGVIVSYMCLCDRVSGSTLIKCGQTEQRLGQSERGFIQSTSNNFLQPLKGFLEGDMKTVQVRP